MGKVLEHDDTDSDRSKGQKLDVGFSETTAQWEETFGLRYWKAGAMYRGSPPSPLTVDKYKIDAIHNNSAPSNKINQNLIQLPHKMLVQVASYISYAIFFVTRKDTSKCKLPHAFWASTIVTFWVHDSYSGDA